MIVIRATRPSASTVRRPFVAWFGGLSDERTRVQTILLGCRGTHSRQGGCVSTVSPDTRPPDAQDWEAVQASPDFVELRRRLRRFVFPMTGLFLVWYLVYVLLADYAHGFMSTKLFGNINV